MNPQPKPSDACLPGAREGADRPMLRRAVPVVPAAAARLPSPWPLELEVEPWHP